MRKRLFMVVAIALMLLVPSAVLLAQAKPTCAKAKEVKEMKLTDEQKAKLQAFRLDQRMKAIDPKAELQKQAIMLKKELMKDQPSMTDVEAILKKMSDARMKLQMIRIGGMLEIRKVLGPDWKMLLKECCPGMKPGAMGEGTEEGEETEAEGPAEMAPMAGCMGAGGPMGEGRRVIMIRKGPGACMEMGEMGGMGGCCMMQKEGKGCCMGSMGGCCMMHKEGKGCGMGSMAGGCMMHKQGKGCGMGSMAGACMKMGEMGGMGKGRMMMKGGKGCSMGGAMMGGCKMGKAGAEGSCSSMAGGWRYKSLYRPHFSGGSSCSMSSSCGEESSCSAGGAHKCSGKCKKEIKVEVETKQ